MNLMSHDSWKRRGSSIIYSRNMLAPFIKSSSMVSLREALSWIQCWPKDPPGSETVILVVGLEACMDMMEEHEGHDFLRKTIRPLVVRFQNTWDQRGLIFGFGCSERQFIRDAQDQVLFKTTLHNTRINLSRGLWNGAASDLYDLEDTTVKVKKPIIGGFHVPRLS